MNKLVLKLNKKQDVNIVDLINIANDSNSKIRIDVEKENIIAEDIEKLAITNFVTAVERYYKIVYVDIVNNERNLIDSNWMTASTDPVINNTIIDEKKDTDALELGTLKVKRQKSLDM